MKQEKNEKKKRDVATQLLRILALCAVVGTHIRPDNLINGAADRYRILFSCTVADGVAVFWLILGFFYFREETTAVRIRRLLKRIVLPMAAVSLFLFYFYDALTGKTSLAQSLSHTAEEYKLLFLGGILRARPVVNGTAHFWYLYAYIFVILLYPALKGIRDAAAGSRKKDAVLAAVLIGLLAFNDLSFNECMEFSHHTVGAVIPACIWVLLGDILWRNLDPVRGRKGIGFFGLVLFFGGNLLRSLLQYVAYHKTVLTEEPLLWYTSYAVLSVTGLALFAFGFFGKTEPQGLTGRLIGRLGGMTFGIYLIHIAVRDVLDARGIRDAVIAGAGDTGAAVFGYGIVYGAAVTGISLLPVLLFYATRRGLRILRFR